MKKVLFSFYALAHSFCAFACDDQIDYSLHSTNSTQKLLLASERDLTKDSSIETYQNSSLHIFLGDTQFKSAGKTAGYFLYQPNLEGTCDLEAINALVTQYNLNKVYGGPSESPTDYRVLSNIIYVTLKYGVTRQSFESSLADDLKVEFLGDGEFFLTCTPGTALEEVKRLKEGPSTKDLVDIVEPDFAVAIKRNP